MDNDNKIGDVSNKVQLFLSESPLFSEIEKPEMYDLEKEYSKTKKNKSLKNIIILAVTVVVVVGISFGITAYIDHKYSNIEVDIEVFDDLNLKNLLNIVGQIQSELNSAKDDKRRLELDMASEISRIDLKLEAEKDLISKKRIPSSLKRNQTEEAEKTAEVERQKVRASYGKKIASLKITIADLEDELANYESSNLERAWEQQNIIDSERQLYEMEKKAQKKEYEAALEELRRKLAAQQKQAVIDQKRAVELAILEYQQRIEVLDPVITDENIIAAAHFVPESEAKEDVLENPENTNDTANDTSLFSSFSSDEKNEEPLFGDDSESIAQKMKDIQTISDYVDSIPYENDLSKYVVAMGKIAQDSNRELKILATEKMKSLESLNSMVSYFDKTFLSSPRNPIHSNDGIVLSMDDECLVCYIVPEKRDLAEQVKKASISVYGLKESCILTLERVGDFFLAYPENPSHLENISENSCFRFIYPETDIN